MKQVYSLITVIEYKRAAENAGNWAISEYFLVAVGDYRSRGEVSRASTSSY